MKIDLTDKIAIITGANQGIGFAIAETLGRAGATILNCDLNKEGLAEAENKLSARGIKTKSYSLDVANGSQVSETIKIILSSYQKIDILVNNAGITRDTFIMRMSEEAWQRVINVNLTGTYQMTKGVIRPMMKRQYGRIINIASVVGIVGNAGQANYAASKAGIIGLTKSTAKELASRQITVNAVAPGFIETDMTRSLTDEIKAKYLQNIPLGRLGTVDDVANTIIFLASDLSKYITGQVFVVDGGMVM